MAPAGVAAAALAELLIMRLLTAPAAASCTLRQLLPSSDTSGRMLPAAARASRSASLLEDRSLTADAAWRCTLKLLLLLLRSCTSGGMPSAAATAWHAASLTEQRLLIAAAALFCTPCLKSANQLLRYLLSHRPAGDRRQLSFHTKSVVGVQWAYLPCHWWQGASRW